jgi:ATP-binding cassette subfamily B protein
MSAEKQKPIRWLFKISKKQNVKMVILILASAVFSVFSTLFAFAIKGIIDGAVGVQWSKILSYSVFILTIVALQFGFRILINGLTEHVRGKLVMDYRSHIFSQILKKKHDKINTYHSGELMNRLTSDVTVVSEGVTNIVPSIVSASARLISAVVALVILDWIFAVAFTVAGICVFLVIALLRGKLKALHKNTQETDGKVRSFMQECIENLLAVKVFSVNGRIEKQSNDLQQDNFKVKMKRKNYSVIGHATYNFIFSAGFIFALIYGAIKIYQGVEGFGPGALYAVLQLVNNVQVPFASLSGILPQYYATLASAERLMDIEEIDNEIHGELIDAKKTYQKMQGISVENLTFTYDRDVVLKNASVFIEKGDFVLISGASGIGKSTLMKLMLGVYPPENGRLFVKTDDGDIALDGSTRTLFSYVPQGNMLFSGTLRDNVTFIKDDASEEEIERALEISQAKEFIDQLPQGLDTVVGENGVGLSEGQIQRIAIARAVLCDAPVILLDEATSALDEETEKNVLDNLKSLKDVTLVIVSHKKAANAICNKVLKIKDKKINVV